MRPFLDKAMPESWKAAQGYAAAVRDEAEQHGLLPQEAELIKLLASRLNGCAYCLDLHSRQARQAGIPQQQLDVLAAWRESALFSEREAAVLAIAEAVTRMPLAADAEAQLDAARATLGEETFAAAEWVAVTINTFNRISILSEHPVRPRDAEGKIVR